MPQLSERTYFNPLPPHGGRLCEPIPSCHIYIFQSTPSAWRETLCVENVLCCHVISIHSLRMEGDVIFYTFSHCFMYFNPLPPHGGRRIYRAFIKQIQKFQSTPSAWRETYIFFSRQHSQLHFNPLPPHGGRPISFSADNIRNFISIHSLRMEGDHERTFQCGTITISIHSLRMEGDELRL